ncbi:rod shape-determining protein RodA [Lactonifactor longoviformis]|uniref:Rod shape determining protein RodA n=1 Tax=Lactonifactor longoviformis DSM 17459 TaxID=1122155 RepID=A0A1M4ZM36_9CLOT|nr:FtsW/RodA/SpoVE family cell cycle protein [Lactonifactor longoviformis]POP32602.1 rod shape-determining protein RodA [Lactonifactor longoviformis]SHF18616.1 rod shape determining protein RodA [Lactonifactor longoviformis DSM 17459]
MLKQYKLKDYNFRLVLWLIAISGVGILLVGSAQHSLQSRQVMGVAMGLAVMLILSLMDFSWILNFYWIIYFGNIIMLLAVRLFGSSAGGATRWIDLGFIRFQPTELSKILLIMFFAKYFMEHEDDLNTFRTLVQSLILLAVPLVLILIQPDLKNTITVVILFCILLYIGGLSYKIIGGALLITIPLAVIFLTIVVQPDQKLLKDYQRDRIMSWLYPENEEYADDIAQQENSKIAIGSGQLTGKGLDNNEVSSANKGNFVSQIQTDFIFAVAGEELGFIGCCCIVGLLLLIIFECVFVGRRAKDLSGKLICCGVGSVIGLQSFINICVATGLMPNTGTPLPFVSYGLTSIVSLYIGMGLVLNVGLQKSKTYIGGQIS